VAKLAFNHWLNDKVAAIFVKKKLALLNLLNKVALFNKLALLVWQICTPMIESANFFSQIKFKNWKD